MVRTIAIVLSLALGMTTISRASDLLVADRLTDSVYRFSATGDFLNVVLTERDVDPETDLISQPTGLALSPDGTQLYVSSSQTNSVIRYDYDGAVGIASNPFVFATAANGLAFPNAIAFSPAGDTIYISNLGETGLTRLNLDGSNAGPNLAPFGSLRKLSGLAWTPDDELLVGGFLDSPAQTRGGVGKSNVGVTQLDTFISPSSALMGTSGLLVHEGYMYVTGMFTGRIQRFDLSDGSLDTSFNVTGLLFPQGMTLSPDGNGMLVGILGYADGKGHIAHYDFDGSLIGDGIFATLGGGGSQEATAFVTTTPSLPLLPGDFNGDRLVNGADLDAWKTHFGDSSGQATLAMGDADGNGIVDGNDFLIWQRHATPAPMPEMQSVPEPTGLGLAALAFAALLRRRFRPAERTT